MSGDHKKAMKQGTPGTILGADYGFEIAYYAFEQCSKISPIMFSCIPQISS